MPTDKELMQQALDAMLNFPNDISDEMFEAMKVLKARLAQPEPEPKCVMIVEVFGKDWRLDYMSLPIGKHKLYTHQYNYTAPPQREWQGLTDEERRRVRSDADYNQFMTAGEYAERVQELTEAKLKEKNAL